MREDLHTDDEPQDPLEEGAQRNLGSGALNGNCLMVCKMPQAVEQWNNVCSLKACFAFWAINLRKSDRGENRAAAVSRLFFDLQCS